MICYTNKWKYPFQIDEEDYERVSELTWYEANQRIVHNDSVNYHTIYLHIFLMGQPPEGMMWDHIDGDPSNNQKENLRPVIRSRNIHNSGPPITNKSGIKGVHGVYTNAGNWAGWKSKITVDDKVYVLGIFKTIEEAAKARKDAEERFGIIRYA